MYLREQSGDMALETKFSCYVTKFSNWKSRGVGKAIQ